MLKRAATLLLALAVVVGMMTQTIPRASGMAAMGGKGMMPLAGVFGTGDTETGQMPCTGMTPACIDLMVCVVAIGMPIAPPSAGSAGFVYHPVAYSFATERLIGRSIDPELFPPILRA